MTIKIKQFIEENKQYIAKEDWYNLFLSYYTHWTDKDDFADHTSLKELINILEAVFPNILEDSFTDRATIIANKMADYFNYVQNNTKFEHVSTGMAIDNLKSRLLMDQQQLYTIFNISATDSGFQVNRRRHLFNIER